MAVKMLKKLQEKLLHVMIAELCHQRIYDDSFNSTKNDIFYSKSLVIIVRVCPSRHLEASREGLNLVFKCAGCSS